MSSVNADVNPDVSTGTAQVLDPDIIENILRECFSGKRDAIRTCKFLNVEMQGQHGTFQALAVDISRSGMLIRVMDPHFASAEEMEHLMPYTARVWYQFEAGFSVSFADTGVTARGNVMRVTAYSGRGRSLILIGCRFKKPLAADDCEKLTIEHADDRPPGD